MSVEPSDLTSEERSDLQDMHGVCWNTDDTFDEDEPDYLEIMDFHRGLGTSHWYLPFHETLSREAFATELEAYQAAGRLDHKIN
ncbi:hypothetical protein D3C71_188900 [compost metagenome]